MPLRKQASDTGKIWFRKPQQTPNSPRPKSHWGENLNLPVSSFKENNNVLTWNKSAIQNILKEKKKQTLLIWIELD